MERRPINKTSESSTRTIEDVPDVGACYTVVEDHGDFVVYSGFDISSDDENDRISTKNSDNDLSGYDGDCDIAQGDVSETETDSDVESRIVFAKKLRSLFQQASREVDSISGMPLESLFESVEEVCDDLNSDESTSDCYGTGYTDEWESDTEDEGLVNGNVNIDIVDRTNVDGKLAPKEVYTEDYQKSSGLVRRKLFVKKENFDVVDQPNVDGNQTSDELFVVEDRKNSRLVNRKLFVSENFDVVDQPSVGDLLPNNLFIGDRENSGIVKRISVNGNENFDVVDQPVDGNVLPRELFVVEDRKNSGLVKRKLSEDDYSTGLFVRILQVNEDMDEKFIFYGNKITKR